MLNIPHLAIHFNRAVNEGNKLSKQKDMLPVVGRLPVDEEAEGWLKRTVARELGVDPYDILDYDLSLYDTTKATVTGAFGDFIQSGRIDDLSMAHAAMSALLDAHADSAATRVMAIFDNEETGSGTKQGAGSPILDTILRRRNLSLGGDAASYLRALAA